MDTVQDLIPESAVAKLLDEVRKMRPSFSSSLYASHSKGTVIPGKTASDFVGQLMAKHAECWRVKRNTSDHSIRQTMSTQIGILELMIRFEVSSIAGEYAKEHRVYVRRDGRLFFRK